MKPKSSCGFDGISSKLLKFSIDALVEPLVIIINQTLLTGTFPDKLKIAKVNPIYKKDDNTQFNNYRPISLLPAISKIFERIIYNQTYDFFLKEKLFYKNQYGFRTEHSTELAALEIVDRLMNRMDNNQTPVNIYLDLSKAFDTIDHNILTNKLEYYGITDNSLKLFDSYLTNRKQYVEFEDTNSDMLDITTGVPQGSILGPLLFIIYINDMANVSKLFDFIIYADDTTLSSVLNSFNSTLPIETNINTELEKINEWLKVNKLSLNVNKTKFMIFHTPQKRVPTLLLKIEGVVIEQVKEFNFLGLILNENLNWKSHTEKIANSVSKSIGIINKLKHFLPTDVKVTLYNSLILSHINYCLLVWGYESDRIKKLQKKAVRVIAVSKYNAHSEPLFKKLKLLKVEDILRLHELKFYFKYCQDKLPFYFSKSTSYTSTNKGKFTINLNNEIHNHNTRQKRNLHISRTNHKFSEKCLRHNITKTINYINNTCPQITNKIHTHSMQGFTKYAKTIFIQNYSETCDIHKCYICNRN